MALKLNREAWLRAMVDRLVPDFKQAGFELPEKIAVSVGFPSKGATSAQRQRIGECWNGAASADGTFHIFISPVIATGLLAADVLVHELCHAVLPIGTGHKKPFAKLATTMGLEGKPTSTNAGPLLTQRLNDLISLVGPYPHSGLAVQSRTKTQTTRLLKAACEGCGYTVRVTSKWLEMGAPICPTCEESMVAETGE